MDDVRRCPIGVQQFLNNPGRSDPMPERRRSAVQPYFDFLLAGRDGVPMPGFFPAAATSIGRA